MEVLMLVKYHLLLELGMRRGCQDLVWIKTLELTHALLALVGLDASERARNKLLLGILALGWEESLGYHLRLVLSKIGLLLRRRLLRIIESMSRCRVLVLREY